MGESLLESLYSLSGRTALVTGGSAGIGRMMSRALLGAGAEVWIVARGEERARTVAAELSPEGRCHAIAADIGSDEGIATVVERFAAAGRRLDLLVNNVGITAIAPLGQVDSSHWDEVMDLNVKAPFMLIQALLPYLERGEGAGPARIVNIGSCAGISPGTRTSYAYFASKAAIHHLTRVLAKELMPRHIHVNAIAPGYFHTDLIDSFANDPAALDRIVSLVPAGRFGGFEDVAGVILMLASNSFMSGNVIPLDGGYLLEH